MLYSGKEQPTVKEHNPGVNNELGPVEVTGGQKAAFIIVCIFTLGLAYIYKIVKNNQLNQMQIKINESASNIDVQLEKRFDTLTKLVSAVSSQAKFDKETLESITAYRSGSKQATLTEKSATIDKISNGINMAFEAYPELGVDQSVRKLMTEATMIEKEIAAARRLYNADVTSFNSQIYTFPVNVTIAKKNYSGIALFASSEEKRKDVKLDF